MNCETYREIASARQDGEAAPEELTTLEHHLTDCGRCRAWVTELTADRERLLDWPEERPLRPLRIPVRRTPWRSFGAAAAVAIAALGIGFAAGRAGSTPGTTGQPPKPSQRFAFVEEQRTVYPARNEIHSEIVLNTSEHSDRSSRRTP